MDPNEKIQLDDITFDDVIAGDGMAVSSPVEELEAPIEKEEVKADDSSQLQNYTENHNETSSEKIEENLEIDFPDDREYDTLAGLILDLTGDIPKKGQVVTFEKYKFKVKGFCYYYVCYTYNNSNYYCIIN